MSVAAYLASGRSERDWEEQLRLVLRGTNDALRDGKTDLAGRYRGREEYDAVLRAHCGLGEAQRPGASDEGAN